MPAIVTPDVIVTSTPTFNAPSLRVGLRVIEEGGTDREAWAAMTEPVNDDESAPDRDRPRRKRKREGDRMATVDTKRLP